MNIRNGLNFARKVLTTDGCDVLILDEVLGLIDKGILTVEELKSVARSRRRRYGADADRHPDV